MSISDVELSALVAFALAGVAGWLIYRGARKLTATETVARAKGK